MYLYTPKERECASQEMYQNLLINSGYFGISLCSLLINFLMMIELPSFLMIKFEGYESCTCNISHISVLNWLFRASKVWQELSLEMD